MSISPKKAKISNFQKKYNEVEKELNKVKGMTPEIGGIVLFLIQTIFGPKDPNKPKAGPNAYNIFSKEYAIKLKTEDKEIKREENQKARFALINKKIGAAWEEMTAEDRQPYIELANEGKKRYEIEIQAYKEGKGVKSTKNEEEAEEEEEEKVEKPKEKSKKKSSEKKEEKGEKSSEKKKEKSSEEKKEKSSDEKKEKKKKSKVKEDE